MKRREAMKAMVVAPVALKTVEKERPLDEGPSKMTVDMNVEMAQKFLDAWFRDRKPGEKVRVRVAQLRDSNRRIGGDRS